MLLLDGQSDSRVWEGPTMVVVDIVTEEAGIAVIVDDNVDAVDDDDNPAALLLRLL